MTSHADPPPGLDESGGVVYSSELVHRKWLSKKAFEIGLSRPAGFGFRAGQTIRMIYGSLERYYSLVTAVDDQTLAICVRHIPTGRFTPVLAEAGSGTRFQFTGPHGYFIFRSSQRPAVFVATGTGIAPFVAMARSGVCGFTLLHGVRTAEELYYQQVFSGIPATYLPCLSEESAVGESAPGAYAGKVTRYIRNHLVRRPHDFYLCGRQEMTRDATLLADELFPGSYVYTEVFF
jgi:ferredoxin-NADP reductase